MVLFGLLFDRLQCGGAESDNLPALLCEMHGCLCVSKQEREGESLRYLSTKLNEGCNIFRCMGEDMLFVVLELIPLGTTTRVGNTVEIFQVTITFHTGCVSVAQQKSCTG